MRKQTFIQWRTTCDTSPMVSSVRLQSHGRNSESYLISSLQHSRGVKDSRLGWILQKKTPADAVNGLVFIPGRLQATSVLKLFPVTPPQSCVLSKLRLNVSNLIYYHRSIGSFLGERCTHCGISHDYSSHKQTFSNGPGMMPLCSLTIICVCSLPVYFPEIGKIHPLGLPLAFLNSPFGMSQSHTICPDLSC